MEEGTFERIGESRSTSVDVRLISATNADLEADVESGRFRQDLFYRINVFALRIPPLRERVEDIELLAKAFVMEFAAKTGKNVAGVNQTALELLLQYSWPGNIRELRNVIERAVLFETTSKIGLSSIMIEPTETKDHSFALFNEGIRDFSLEKAERELIARALHETGWQKTQAASLLGITRATLYAKVKHYNIQKQIPKQSDVQLAPAQPTQGQPVTIG